MRVRNGAHSPLTSCSRRQLLSVLCPRVLVPGDMMTLFAFESSPDPAAFARWMKWGMGETDLTEIAPAKHWDTQNPGKMLTAWIVSYHWPVLWLTHIGRTIAGTVDC